MENNLSKKNVRYSGRFVKESFGDMHPVEAGKAYTKTWTFRNDGETAWPLDTLFCIIGGD